MKVFKATMLIFILLVGALPATTASTIGDQYYTPPIVLHSDSSANFTQADIATDSHGNLHTVSVREGAHIYYSLSSRSGEMLIDKTQITNPGIHRIGEPDIEVDEFDRVHAVWADEAGQHSIVYTVLNPWAASLNGSESDDSTLTLIDDTIVVQRNQNRNNPGIAIDSLNNVHLVWEDLYNELGGLSIQPEIYYKLLHPNILNATIETLVDDTIISVGPKWSMNPQVVLSSEDVPTVVWDETSNDHAVELMFVLDTSGSMYAEWADVCTLVYGGNFASGGYFQGLKPMLNESNLTVYETIYGLGDTLPGAASSGNCAGHNQNSGPRTTPLGPGDDSGGIRKLPGTVYNGNTYAGYSGEDWGPGTNWGCLSWKDASGNVPGNPPTADDHKWNLKAKKMVLPVSDEGPKDGDPSQQADDLTSIEEAHDNCLTAGVIPFGLYGQGYGGAGNVQSHFMDLAQCPNGVVSIQTRNCPGNTLRSSDAGGQAYEFPSGTAAANAMTLLIEAMVYSIFSNAPMDIVMKTIDPYHLMETNQSWANGSSAHSIVNGEYEENLGEFVRIQHSVITKKTNITASNITFDNTQPSVQMDAKDRLHLVWTESSTNIINGSTSSSLQYAMLDVSTNRSDGVPEGLEFNASRMLFGPESLSNNSSNPLHGSQSIALSPLGDAHIVWLGGINSTHSQIMYTTFDLESLETHLENSTSYVTNWTSSKLIQSSSAVVASSNEITYIAWDDTYNCDEAVNSNLSSICHIRFIGKGLNYTFSEEPPFTAPFQPGETRTTLLNLSSEVFPPDDINQFLISRTFTAPSILTCDAKWDISFRLLNQSSTLASLPFSFLTSAAATVAVVVTAPGDDQFEEGQMASLCLEVIQTIGNGTRSVATITINVTSTIEHAWTLDLQETPMYGVKGEIYTLNGTVTNQGTANDRFQIVSNPISNTSCDGCIVSTGPSFPLGPGESRTVSILVNLSTFEAVYLSLTVENLDTAESFCDVLTVSLWCALDIVPLPLGDFISVESSQNNYLIEDGTCLNTTVKINLEEAGFATDLNISIYNPSLLSTFYNPIVKLPKSNDSSEFSVTWCSESSSPLVEMVNVTVQVSISEFEDYAASLNLTFFPYTPAIAIIESLINPTSVEHDATTYPITGYLDANVYSGNATLVIGFSQDILNRSYQDVEVISSLGQAYIVQSQQRVYFDRILKFDDGSDDDSQRLSVYVQVCDFGGCTVEVYELERIQDRDGDGVGDNEDVFPDNAQEWLDSDDDGVGDNTDAFPYNASENKDSDGDGFGDNMDLFPKDGNEWFDSDGDGYGDNMDAFPFDPLEHSDLDGDGVGDARDAYPFDASRWENEMKDDSSWSKIMNGDLSGVADEPVVMTFAFSAILLGLIALLQTNLIAQFIPESLRLVGFARSRKRESKEDDVWFEQLRSICQLMKDDISGLREWLVDEKITVKGEGIGKETSSKSIERRLSVLELLSSLNDEELTGVWKNHRLFGVSELSDTISDLRDEQLFMDQSGPVETSMTSPLLFEHSDALESSEIAPILDANGYEWIQNEHGEYLYRRADSKGEWMKYEN